MTAAPRSRPPARPTVASVAGIEPAEDVAAAVDGHATVVAGFRPEHLRLVAEGGSAAATLDAVVEVVEYLGDEQLVHLAAGETTFVTKLVVDRLRPAPGDRLQPVVPRGRFMLFDPDSERRLDADRLAGV